jgi:DNA-binding FadR family transcriptional regulator
LADDQLAHFQPTSMEHVLMLLDYRRLIESETARRAATLATPIEVRAMRESAEVSLAAGKAVDAEAFTRADALFHDCVSIAAPNVFLRSSVANIRRLVSQSDVLLFHGDVPDSLGRRHPAPRHRRGNRRRRGGQRRRADDRAYQHHPEPVRAPDP